MTSRFNESADNTLLDEEDIQAIAQQVWPEEQDEDFED